MKKIPTLFVRDTTTWALTDKVTPGCEWVLWGEGTPTTKYDGVCVMLDDSGKWWARREVKKGKNIPPNFQPIDHDEFTGKTFGWVPIVESPAYRFHEQALAMRGGSEVAPPSPGTFELVGQRINGNPYRITGHVLTRHGISPLMLASAPVPLTKEWLHEYMTNQTTSSGFFEGIVWHREDGRMAKLKVRDFK